MKKIYLIPIMFLLTISLVLGVGETMTRGVPSSADEGSTFSLTYNVIGDSPWGVSVVDSISNSISGGCTFPGGLTTLNEAYLSEDYSGNEIVVEINAVSTGSCVFRGDYKFDAQGIVDFSDNIVTITTPSPPSNGGGGGGGGGGVSGPTCYVIEGDTCVGKDLSICYGLSSDEKYSTKSLCESNLPDEEEPSKFPWSTILVLGLMVGGGYYFYTQNN